jgi:hypothetical protein
MDFYRGAENCIKDDLMTPTRTVWMLVAGALALILIFLSSIFYSGFFLGLNPSVIHSPDGFVVIRTAIPDMPREMPLYHGYLGPNNSIDMFRGSVMTSKENVTSGQEAPEVARKALEPYGGLPYHAELLFSETNYLEKHQSSPRKRLERKPAETTGYHRIFNGSWTGGDVIRVSFGSDGEVLEIRKIWRTLEYTGTDASLITSRQALIKISQGETLSRPMCCPGVFFLDNISAGYTVNSNTDTNANLEPVWIFSGTLEMDFRN